MISFKAAIKPRKRSEGIFIYMKVDFGCTLYLVSKWVNYYLIGLLGE